MQQDTVVTRTTFFISDVLENVRTSDETLASYIRWADENPVVWKIITTNKSKVFGKSSSTYMGFQRGDAIEAILARLKIFKDETEKDDPFFGWRARFTLRNFEAKGFKSGFFRQSDGEYDRGCAYLDYTQEKLEKVVRRFKRWCEASPLKHPTIAIKLDDKIVKTYEKGDQE